MSKNMRIEAQKDFGTRECPSCGLDVPVNENICPVCGYEFPNTPEPSRTVAVVGWIVFGILLAAILLALIF